jgi:hypothetical protein
MMETRRSAQEDIPGFDQTAARRSGSGVKTEASPTGFEPVLPT